MGILRNPYTLLLQLRLTEWFILMASILISSCTVVVRN